MAHPLENGWTRDLEVRKFDPEGERVRNPDPYDYGQAKRAHARASREQAEAAVFKARAWREYAKAEKAYRLALRLEITRLHLEEGVAWTACGDMARGETKVADLKLKRDVAEGLAKAADDVSYQRAADRRVVDQLTAWSMRIAPDGQYDPPPVVSVVRVDAATGEVRA